jgi:hypothetical protein
MWLQPAIVRRLRRRMYLRDFGDIGLNLIDDDYLSYYDN